MKKKFFDILPPKPFSTPLPEEESVKETVDENANEEGKEVKTKRGPIVFLLIIAVLGLAFSHFVLSKVNIEIWPDVENLNFQKEITVDGKTQESDVKNWFKENTIPGQMFAQEKEISEQFTSSGSVEKNVLAKGKIRVYNQHTVLVGFVSGTHFRSDSGQQFHSLSKVTVPAKGYTDVNVEADLPGEEYNIGLSKFSIPGLRKTSSELFYSVWGESSDSMTGGFSGKASQVTQEDLDKAEKTLVEKLLKESESSFGKAIPPDFVLPQGALSQEIVDKNYSAKAGDAAESFTIKVKVNSKALIFKKSDLEAFTKEAIYSKLKASQKIDEKSLALEYKLTSLDLENSKISIDLKGYAKAYENVNIEALRDKIKGETLARSEEILAQEPDIFKARVTAFPFWIKIVPQNQDKVKIKLNID